MTLRVARIITRLNVGGPAYQATILNYLLKQKYNCQTLLIYGQVCSDEIFYESLLNEYPSESVFCKYLHRDINPLYDILAIRQIKSVLKKFQPDIVHTHTAKAGFIGRTAAKIVCPNAAIIHTYHGHVFNHYFSSAKENIIIKIERALARKSDCLIAISQTLKEELSERFRIAPKDKFSVIELGLPLDKFLSLPPRGKLRQMLGIPENAIVLGTLGRLVPIKNHLRMIRILDLLISNIKNDENLKSTDIRLIIGGTGQLEQKLKQEAKIRNLSEKIFFPGLIDDLQQFYSDIDIALLTSDNEGTPVMLIEAQSAGRYVIAPDVGGIRDIIYPQCGTIIKPNSPENYVDVLINIMKNRNKYNKISETIRREIAERFSPERLTDDIYNLYQRISNATGTR